MTEPESMRSMLERPISQLQTLSQALFSALSTGDVTQPPIAALAACDAELAEAMRLTRIHLLKQKRIEQLMDEVYELDAQLIEVVETLATGQRELQAIIEEGEERISSADKARESAVSYQQLIAYGSKLANFTSVPPTAPADDKEPAPGPYGFYPPFPDTEMMQRAKLALQGPIGPVGETRVIGDTKAPPFTEPGVPTQGRPRPTQQVTQVPTRRQALTNMDIFDLDLNPDIN